MVRFFLSLQKAMRERLILVTRNMQRTEKVHDLFFLSGLPVEVLSGEVKSDAEEARPGSGLQAFSYSEQWRTSERLVGSNSNASSGLASHPRRVEESSAIHAWLVVTAI